MPGRLLFGHTWLLVALLNLAPIPVRSQIIDFETLPGGAPTVDQQEISDQYASYGVTFTLLDRGTGLPIGFPRIAKAGPPRTAFNGCLAADTPWPNLGLGTSFLTDGTALGVEGDVRIEYSTPVAQVSGVIIDIDCRDNGGPPCEQWTISAYDSVGVFLQSVVLDGPPGPMNPQCQYPEVGPGDSQAFGWAIEAGAAQISSIILRYTGEPVDVGLAFDNFSVASLPGPPAVAVVTGADTICFGESLELAAEISGGLPPYSYQWQLETSPGSWVDLGSASTQEIMPVTTSSYRVIVTDSALNETTSAPATIAVTSGPLCDAGLLVSSYANDRIVRYGFQSRLASIFVASGGGGLNGPSKLTCGDDGHLYVSSQANDRVLRYDGATGAFMDIFVAAGSGGLNIPIGLDFGPDGNLYVVSNANHSVLRYDGTTGAFIDAFVPNGSGLNSPTGMVFGPDDDLYVCSLNSDKVLRFDGTTGAPLGDFVSAGSGGLDSPRGLTFGPDGNLYIAEEINDSVRRYDGTTGAFIDIFVASGSGGLDRAQDVAFGPDGIFYVTSFNNDQVLCYDGGSGAFLGALPDELLDAANWFAVGCVPLATTAPVVVGRHSLELVVEPNTPNPFNPSTIVGFTLPANGHVRVTVHDVHGRLVCTLLDDTLPAGRHRAQWNGLNSDGRPAQSGVYFLRVESGRNQECVKMVLVR
jgi:DNA-binding beta-propeller fold protein YncE